MDLAIQLDENGADLALDKGDLKLDPGLPTAVLVSLFSDGLAPQDRVRPGEDRRGWWGQAFTDDPFGSLLWTSERGKLLPDTVNTVREDATAALRWLVDEGIASTVSVIAERCAETGIALDIEIERGTSRRWAFLWDELAGHQFEAPGVRVKLLAP